MKIILCVILCTCIFTACQKTVAPTSIDYFQHVHEALKKTEARNQPLNLSAALKTVIEGRTLVRIPFENISIAEKFVLLQTSEKGDKIIKGRIIEVYKRTVKHYTLSGQFIPKRSYTRESAELEEVIVISYIPRNETNVDYGSWYNLWAMLGNSSIENSGWYVEMKGGSSGGSGTQEAELVEFDDGNIKVADVKKMMKCFDNVPSSGATYAIKLNVDIPVNNNPYASTFGEQKSAVGHVFISLTKTNGINQVTQVFGFYPATSVSLQNPSTQIAGTIANNGDHEVNARILMSINEAQFNHITSSAISLAQSQYSLTDFNCTSYALQLFNSVRNEPIQISPYAAVFPNFYNPLSPNIVTINHSPQMLFIALQNMKNEGGSESGNVILDATSNTKAAGSSGECD